VGSGDCAYCQRCRAGGADGGGSGEGAAADGGVLAGAADAAAASFQCCTGDCDRRASDGGRADAVAPGGSGADPAGGGAGGHTSPTSAEHVLADLDGRIDAVLDAGPTNYGVESTVLDPCSDPMIIYRPGAVTLEQIRKIAGPVEIYREARESRPPESLPSPGVGLRHYAPTARLVLVEAELTELAARMAEAARGLEAERVGVMLPAEVAAPAGVAAIFSCGRWAEPEEMAHALYAGLRELDGKGCTVILCPLPPVEGIGAAIRDRLKKAGTKGLGTRD